MFDQSYIPGRNATCSWYVIIFIRGWIQPANIFFRIFASVVVTDIIPSSGFGMRVMLASQNELGSIPSTSTFWKTLQRVAIISSLNVWQNSLVNPSGPGAFCFGRVLIVDSIFLIDTGLFTCLFLPVSLNYFYWCAGKY